MGNLINLDLLNYYSAYLSPARTTGNNAMASLICNFHHASRAFSQTATKSVKKEVPNYLSSIKSLGNDYLMSSEDTSKKSSDNTSKEAANPSKKARGHSNFDHKKFKSRDQTLATATATRSKSITSYSLEVSNLATKQVSGEIDINSQEKSFTTGVNTFEITTASGTEKSVSFTVYADDTNQTTLGSIADAINSSDSGVFADVISDSETGMSYLSVSSNKTGKDNDFSIIDINGNSAAITGIDKATQEAQDAKYIVNGTEYTSSENTISIDNNSIYVQNLYKGLVIDSSI